MKNRCPKWPLSKIKQIAANYTYIRDFKRDFHVAYKIAHRNGWLDELGLVPVPPSERKQNIVWTYERTRAEALKYNTRSEFAENCSGGYHRALKQGWLDEFGLLKAKPKAPNLKWDHKRTRLEASKYTSRGEFQKKNQSAYQAAWRNKWLDEFFPT